MPETEQPNNDTSGQGDPPDESRDRKNSNNDTSGQGDPPDDSSRRIPVGELAEERKRRQTAERESTELRSRIEQLEAANLSELEKAQRRAEKAEKELSDSRLASLRQRVALDKGLPSSLVPRLQGTTEAELYADADELLGLVKTSNTPKPDPSQGSRDGDPRTSTADQWAETVGGLFT